MKDTPSDAEIEKAIRERLTVPLWPYAGRALGLRRGATYTAASEGKIKTLAVCRNKDVPTAWLRSVLGIEREPRAESASSDGERKTTKSIAAT